ncbi:Reverse transcriptase (RNA-dependent DNA polymerase) [Popillia japonica]|uniref:Reverse transcriptase (RNA-dependent DNA polymerase) n=1 Tax=Popillia japonica TaxID=7064 RepID=A0AAW1ISF5_POPJA
MIGADFLNKHGVVIDYDSREIRLDKNCVKFENVIKRRMENEGWQELIINGLYEGMNDSIYDKEIFDVRDELNENGDCDENISVERNVMNVVDYEEDGMGNKKEGNDSCELNYKCQKQYKEFVFSLFKNNKRLVDETACIAPDIFQHKLVVNESLPFNPKIYPIPEAFRAQVSREIQKMLDNKVIERTVTSFINPIVVVKKKSGDIRLCLDARLLNTRLEKQYELPGRIDAILSSCYRCTVFSKLDLKHSFWLIKLHEDSRKYTGFTIAGTTYQFRVVPFGISTATSALTHALERMLNQYSKFCVYYVDDIF